MKNFFNEQLRKCLDGDFIIVTDDIYGFSPISLPNIPVWTQLPAPEIIQKGQHINPHEFQTFLRSFSSKDFADLRLAPPSVEEIAFTFDQFISCLPENLEVIYLSSSQVLGTQTVKNYLAAIKRYVYAHPRRPISIYDTHSIGAGHRLILELAGTYTDRRESFASFLETHRPTAFATGSFGFLRASPYVQKLNLPHLPFPSSRFAILDILSSNLPVLTAPALNIKKHLRLWASKAAQQADRAFPIAIEYTSETIEESKILRDLLDSYGLSENVHPARAPLPLICHAGPRYLGLYFIPKSHAESNKT